MSQQRNEQNTWTYDSQEKKGDSALAYDKVLGISLLRETGSSCTLAETRCSEAHRGSEALAKWVLPPAAGGGAGQRQPGAGPRHIAKLLLHRHPSFHGHACGHQDVRGHPGLLEVVEHQESLVPHRGRHVAREGSTSKGRGRALETCFPVAHRTWEKWTKSPFPKLWKLLKTCNNPKSACPVISNLLGQSIKRNLCDHQLITKLTKQRFQWLTMIKNTDLQNQSREDIKQIATTISSRGGDSDFQSRHVVLFKTYNFK